ncbi:hypothetical protein ACERK3_07470 [Phycisphaerales bacterium AB-hyl4]|uniref:Uncharacterized protein n=1 Tax=Natronomicrosphaera hydrolytica TaxID=3242702 RepID=A0ABV4U5W0_9BACT
MGEHMMMDADDEQRQQMMMQCPMMDHGRMHRDVPAMLTRCPLAALW